MRRKSPRFGWIYDTPQTFDTNISPWWVFNTQTHIFDDSERGCLRSLNTLDRKRPLELSLWKGTKIQRFRVKKIPVETKIMRYSECAGSTQHKILRRYKSTPSPGKIRFTELWPSEVGVEDQNVIFWSEFYVQNLQKQLSNMPRASKTTTHHLETWSNWGFRKFSWHVDDMCGRIAASSNVYPALSIWCDVIPPTRREGNKEKK